MPWNLRLWRRKKIGPGLSINLSKSGPSLSIGPRGAKTTVGPRGIRQTVGLPGTGLFASTQTSWRPREVPARADGGQSDSASIWQNMLGGDTPLPVPAAPPGESEALSTPPTASAVPRTADQVAALLAGRPPGWEYLYFAALLKWGRDASKSSFGTVDSISPLRTAPRLDDQVAAVGLSESFTEHQDLIAAITYLFAPDRLQRAFGLPGVAGDPDAIGQLAARWTAVYDGLLSWIAWMRGVQVSDLYREIYDAASHLADDAAREYDAYIDTFVRTMDGLPQRLAAGEPVNIDLTLTLSMDDAALQHFNQAVARARVRL
jgi:hypothetical protein